jgi:type VI secretion system secreted protein VgrG
MVMVGSPTVFIDYMMACRMGDIVVEIPGLAMGPADPIIMGCPTVIIGDVGMGSPDPSTMGQPMTSMASNLGGSVGSAAQALAGAAQAGAGVVPVTGNPLLSQAIGNNSQDSPTSKQVWVEIELLDQQNGKPVPNEPYRIELPDGTVSEGSTDDNGLARVDGIDPGNCKITFPSLDQRSWKKK